MCRMFGFYSFFKYFIFERKTRANESVYDCCKFNEMDELNEFPHADRGQVLLPHVNFTTPFIF